ncbi:thermonuclease family protein [Roseivivax isoporae]|uniref:Nuclease n=1 Tax=Roseivivax isoporae LMG 25204 TaxID=1449351 RepID=X7FAZ6_9RHOB|nr:thermonuclease family protein [Roseivivax isoporae]ETX29269.1 nuclease [Roseivivax isoporae LMG 25204]
MLRICSISVLAVALGLSLAAARAAADPGPAGTVRVVDGDTFDVGGTRVRLHAVDAPEHDQTCGGQGAARWACGAWVTAEVRRRYEGRRAECTARDEDRYGRVVATCRVGGRDMGAALVRDGLILAYPRYGETYVALEKEALVAGRGLHAAAMQRPERYREAQRAATSAPAPAPRGAGDCAIKGNIGGSGERIYHVPGQRDYAATRISGDRGERWFCTEEAARAAGWRRAMR